MYPNFRVPWLVPACLYGCETWTLTKKIYQRIKVAELKLLRAVAAYKLIDQKKVDNRAELDIIFVALNKRIQKK